MHKLVIYTFIKLPESGKINLFFNIKKFSELAVRILLLFPEKCSLYILHMHINLQTHTMATRQSASKAVFLSFLLP
jgi:hypothetical protein